MNEQKSASADSAIKGCDAVIGETLKNLANAYYFRGTAKFAKSDFDGAIGDYGQALRLDPSDADYLNSRAAAYEAKKDVDRALADYNKAIKTRKPQFDLRLQQPRRRLSKEGRIRPRRRRLRRGDAAPAEQHRRLERALLGARDQSRPDATGAVGLQRGAQDQA